MKTIRLTSLILLITILNASFAGCNQIIKNTDIPSAISSSASAAYNTSALPDTSAQSLPIVKEPITFRVWTPYIFQNYVKSNSIMESNIELERRTGIKIEWIEPPAGQTAEAYNLMIASHDLPDMIEDFNGIQTNDYSYPGGYDKAIEDGVILKLNDLIDKYAPNYKQIVNSDKTAQKLTITDKGNMYGVAEISTYIKNINDPIIPQAGDPGNGLVIRKDWLDELGFELPVTIDDWHTVLKAFKEKKKAGAPLLINKTGIGLNSQFLTAFGTAYTNRTGQEFYQENGKVKFGPIEPGFKDYLALMNKWYEEGLIDKSFAVRDDNLDVFSAECMPSDKAGATNLGCGWAADYYKVAGSAKDPRFYLQAVNPPVARKGNKIHFRYTTWSVGGFTVITTACKYPKEAMKWLDYQYSKEGILMTNWGKQGVTYNIKDGKPVFTDLILKDQNPLVSALLHTRSNSMSNPGVADAEWFHALPIAAQTDAKKIWGEVDNSWVIPPLYLTRDEETSYSAVMSDIKTYINEMTVKFIMGIEPISNYDAFASQIRDMGIDQVIKAEQDALDRYNKR